MIRSVQEGPRLADTLPSHPDTEVSRGTGHCSASSKVLLKPFPGGRKFLGLEFWGPYPEKGAVLCLLRVSLPLMCPTPILVPKPPTS